MSDDSLMDDPGSLDDHLRPRVAAGVRWGAIDQIAQVIVRFGATLVMARLLDPGDFGLFALAMVVLNLAGLVVGVGMSDAIIQRRELQPGHVTTAFTISAACASSLHASDSGAISRMLTRCWASAGFRKSLMKSRRSAALHIHD